MIRLTRMPSCDNLVVLSHSHVYPPARCSLPKSKRGDYNWVGCPYRDVVVPYQIDTIYQGLSGRVREVL